MPSVELLSLLQLPSNSGLLHQFDGYVVNNLKVVLQDVPDVEVLTKRVEDAARDFRKSDSCLGMVDLWRKNIVIDSDKNIFLLDWELFGWSNASWEMSYLGVLFLFIYLSLNIDSIFLSFFTNSPNNALYLIEIKYYGRCEESHHRVY